MSNLMRLIHIWIERTVKKIENTFCGPLLILVFVTWLLDWFYLPFLLHKYYEFPPPGIYRSSFIFGAVLSHPVLFAVFFTSVFGLFWNYRELKWSQFSYGKTLKWLVVFTAIPLTWKFSTYDYNLYFNHSHMLDRILLIGYQILLLMHPALIAPYLVQLLIMLSQFFVPMEIFTLNDFKPLLVLLIAFNAFLYLKIFLRRRLTHYFFYLSLAIIGASYFRTGLRKLLISNHLYEWALNCKLEFMVATLQFKGADSFLPPTWGEAILSFVQTFDPLLTTYTVLIENSGIFILFHPVLTITLLLGYIALHFGIFITTGVVFWKWVIMDIVFIGVLVFIYQNLQLEQAIFSNRNFIISLILIPLLPVLFNLSGLGSWETRYTRTYRFYVTDVEGNKFRLSKNSMAPYDKFFTFDRFHYILDKPILKRSTNSQYLKGVINSKSSESIKELIRRYGRNHYKSRKAKKFDKFIQKIFKNWNQRLRKGQFLSKIWDPKHIYTLTLPAKAKEFRWDRKVSSVKIYFVEGFYSNKKIHTLDKMLVRTINVPLNEVSSDES